MRGSDVGVVCNAVHRLLRLFCFRVPRYSQSSCEVARNFDEIGGRHCICKAGSLLNGCKSLVTIGQGQAKKILKKERTRTRNSATAEKQHVSCACLPRLVNWSCSAQNTAESQRLYYCLTLKCSDWRSAGRKRILSWNSHSRSFKAIHFAIIC